jgi:hypothetical protein
MTMPVQATECAGIAVTAGPRGCAFVMNTHELAAASASGLAVSRNAKPSELRQAKLTNNVISPAFVGQSNPSEFRQSVLSACKPLNVKTMQVCAAKVNASRELGTRLAFYWAVPRQGYK